MIQDRAADHMSAETGLNVYFDRGFNDSARGYHVRGGAFLGKDRKAARKSLQSILAFRKYIGASEELVADELSSKLGAQVEYSTNPENSIGYWARSDYHSLFLGADEDTARKAVERILKPFPSDVIKTQAYIGISPKQRPVSRDVAARRLRRMQLLGRLERINTPSGMLYIMRGNVSTYTCTVSH